VLYARFIGDAVDYVVNQLIETTLRKDHEFLTGCQELTGESSFPPGDETPDVMPPRQLTVASEAPNDSHTGAVMLITTAD
jgi:hypothetical protein